MKKKIAKSFVIFALCFGMIFSSGTVPFVSNFTAVEAQAAEASGKTGKCSWSISGSTLTISGNGPMANYGKGKAPWYKYRKEITTINVESGVKRISQYAFYGMKKVTAVNGCESVIVVRKYAFAKCKSLESITLGNIQRIAPYAFYGCKNLSSVTLGSSLKEKSSTAFKNCPKLSESSVQETASGKLTGAECVVTTLDYYASALKSAVKNGEKWVYSNNNNGKYKHYIYEYGTFSDMLNKKDGADYRGANCASLTKWVLRDLGILPSGSQYNVFATSGGKLYSYNSGTTNSKKYIDAACDVISVGGKSFKTLVASGTAKAGDICVGKSYLFIYRGGNTIFTSGRVSGNYKRDSSIKTEYSPSYVYTSWTKNSLPSTNVYYIIRVKSGYTPKTYRNSNGNVVSNG